MIIAIRHDMDMPMDMMPAQPAPSNNAAARPETAETLRQSSRTQKETEQPDGAFELLLAGLLNSMGMAQQGPSHETSEGAQAEATVSQVQAMVPVNGVGSTVATVEGVAVAAGVEVIETIEGATAEPLAQGPVSQQDVNDRKPSRDESAGPALHGLTQQSGKDEGGAEVFPAPVQDEKAENSVIDFGPAETRESNSNDRQAPEVKTLPQDAEHDRGGIRLKASALQEASEDPAFRENADKGFQTTEDVRTISGSGQSREAGVSAIAGKAESPHMPAEPAAIAQTDRPHASSETMHVAGHKFIITRNDGTSIEISLQPEGLGKLDIDLVFDKGALHAQIQTSHEAARELVEQNIGEVMNALAREGITIGGFSVSLRQGGDADPRGAQSRQRRQGEGEPDKRGMSPIRQTDIENTINIFV
jgi:flagellar hook-length control protein FliK